MKFLFVINPGAGGSSKDIWITAIRLYFESAKHAYDCYEMSSQGNQSSLRQRIADLKPDRVVALGGDGTLKFCAEQLLYSGISLAFLPAGSANGMAKELGIPTDMQAALRIAVEGTSRKMDVVCINGNHYSLHLSDMGMNAQLVKYFEESNTRGKWGYFREVWKVLHRRKRISLRIKVDGQQLRRKAWMIVIANGQMYGTGMAINPDGSLYDGLFEVVLLKQISMLEMLKMVIKNRKFDSNKTEVIKVKELQIQTSAPIYFQVDGEYIGEIRALEAKMEHAAIDIVTEFVD